MAEHWKGCAVIKQLKEVAVTNGWFRTLWVFGLALCCLGPFMLLISAGEWAEKVGMQVSDRLPKFK